MPMRTPKVFVQMCLLSEAVEAEDTLEGPLTRVCSQVYREVGFPTQLAFADRAEEFLPPVLVGGGVTLFYKVLVQFGLVWICVTCTKCVLWFLLLLLVGGRRGLTRVD